jgi:hypothetical protein
VLSCLTGLVSTDKLCHSDVFLLRGDALNSIFFNVYKLNILFGLCLGWVSTLAYPDLLGTKCFVAVQIEL